MTSNPTTGPTGLMLAGLLLSALVIPPVGPAHRSRGADGGAIRDDRLAALVFGAMMLLAVFAALLVQQLITAG